MEAAYEKVPQVVIPQMTERVLNSKIVKELGLGDWLNHLTCTPEDLRKKCIQVINDKSLIPKMEAFSKIIKS